MQKLATSPYKADKVVLGQIEDLTKSTNKKVKAAAINYLVKNGDAKYLSIYQTAVNDSSYSVAGEALKGLVALDAANAYTLAKKFSSDAKGALGNVINDILIDNGTEADFDFITKKFADAPLSFEKVTMTKKYAEYLGKLNNVSKIKTGIDKIIDFRNQIPEQFRGSVDAGFKSALDKLGKAKGTEVEDYIKSVFK